MLKYAGWFFSLILLIMLIVAGYSTNARTNSLLKAQADSFTTSLVTQGAQRDAQWQAKLNADMAERDATWNATVIAAMSAARDAAIAERNTTWNATLASTSAQRDAYWLATMNSTLSSAIAQRDAWWQATLNATIAALQGT